MASEADEFVESIEYKALKKYENELIECLESVNLVSLARQAAECGVIPGEVKANMESLHPTAPHPLVCRYLFYSVYYNVTKDSKTYDSWVVILSNLKEITGVLSQIKQCRNELLHVHDNIDNFDEGKDVVLTESHVSDLIEVLANCTSKWKEIGTALGLLQNEIDNIFATYFHSPVMCLTKVLSAWVMCKFSTAKSPHLENLEKALHSKTVGLGAEASQLRDKVKKQMSKINYYTTEDRPVAFEIISQTLDQNFTEATSILLEVRVTALKNPVTFDWLRDGHHIESQICYSYNGEYSSIFFLLVRDLLAEGAYTCNVTNSRKEILVSKPILITLTTPLDKYQQNLVDFYTEQSEVPEDTWPPVSTNTFISLALIKQDSIHHAGDYGRVTIRGDADDIYSDKESLVYEKAFSGLESGTRLLIEGRPGSGKTTLVHKISQDWAKDSLTFKHVRLLFLVHLRAFSSDPGIELRDIINCYFRSKPIKDEIDEYAEKHSGLGFCFILDGLDEYLPNNSNAYIFQLIKKLVLPKSIVIIASRPAAAAKFRSKASRQVEVIGFLKQQISDYVNSYPLSDHKSEQLHQYLEQHPNVHHMCYLPIHTAMVCFLFNHLDTDLPQTETETYKQFAKFTILRVLYRHDEESQVYMNSIDDLPQSKKDTYKKICELAYEMCKSSKQVMTQAEAQSIFSARDDSDSLGLVTLDKMAMLCGFQHMYTFLHLTFQEFLAAYYIASLEEKKQFDLIVELGNTKQMQQVWKFYCGLTKFDIDGKKFKAIIQNSGHGSLFNVQCGFESQQPHICDTIIQDGCLFFSDTFLSPSNFTEIAFVLSNAHQHYLSSLSFEGCVFGQECVEILMNKAKRKLSSLTTLCYHRCNDSEQLEVVNSFLKYMPSLELLDISDSVFGIDGIKSLTNDLNHSSIQILRVGGRGSLLYSSPEILQELADVFLSKCSNSFNIQFAGIGRNLMPSNLKGLPFHFHFDFPDLDLSTAKLSLVGFRSLSLDLKRFPYFVRLSLADCGIDNEIASCLALGLKHCRDLEILELAFNKVGDSGAIDIASSVQAFTNLKVLDLTHNNLSDHGALELAHIFKSSDVRFLSSFNNISSHNDILQVYSNVEFHMINVSNRDLGHSGADCLASNILSSCNCSDILQFKLSKNSLSHLSMNSLSSVLAQCSNLLILDLSSNALSVAGAVILSGALKHCVKLHNLDLSSNHLGNDGAKAITGSLMCCTNLLQLRINSNNIGSEGMKALVEALKHCAIFQELEVRSNAIKYGGMKALAHAFSSKYWVHFYVLDVSSNCISNEGIKILAEALAQCTTLQELYISNNDIQSDGADFLAFSLESCTDFQVLDIGSNSLQSSGAKAIADALHRSTSLHTLDISNNNIGSDGTQGIANALQHWTKISKLNISHNGMDSKGATHLAQSLMHCKSQNLTKLDLSNNAIIDFNSALSNALKYFIHIEELSIKNNSIGNMFMKDLACSLEHWRNIHILNLSCTSIGSTGAKILSRGLIHCSQLRELYVSKNKIGDDGATALAEILRNMNNLRVIDISSNDIGNVGTAVFISSLEVCTLHELNISENLLGSEGIEKLANILQQNQGSIRALVASGINLDSEATRVLANGLKLCINLQKLDISSNEIGAKGTEAILEALKHCTTLRVLDVSHNSIGIGGANAIADFQISFVHVEINISSWR